MLSAALMAPGGARAVARCDLLGAAPYSEMEGGLDRAYLTPAHRAAVDSVGAWMAEAGMTANLDPVANLVGRYEGSRTGAPTLLIGSHLDSVRDAGRYDGPLGVMLGIECVAALSAQGRRLPFAIEVIGFGDEEGSRYPAMLTSRAIAGTLRPEMLAIADAAGVALDVALADFTGCASDSHAILSTARPRGGILAYLETHIEQGPVLEAAGLALGNVTGIAAQRRYQLSVQGVAGHAGTMAMHLRRDALAAAAEMILAIEERAQTGPPDLVATVGQLTALPGAVNVVPGRVVFTIDVRAGAENDRDAAADDMLSRIAAIAAARGVAFEIERTTDLAASPCDPALMDLMDAALADCGQPPFRLVSGAGHDAMVMAALCPTAMLFIRCKDGISHNPAEHVDPADADVALAVMLAFIDRLGERFANA